MNNMSLSELISKKKTLEGKIEKESTRIEAVENKRLAEVKSAYDTKQQALDQWNSNVKN